MGDDQCVRAYQEVRDEITRMRNTFVDSDHIGPPASTAEVVGMVTAL